MNADVPQPGPLSRRRMAFADGNMSFLAGGKEGPVVVFVHGAGLNAQTYRNLLTRLSSSARVLAPDLRGHGATSLPADPEELPDWRFFAQDLISFIDAAVAPTERPLVLVGDRMGATVCLLATGARPDFVRGLVLVEPVLYPPLVLSVIEIAQRFNLVHRLPFYETVPRRRAVWPERAPLLAALRETAPFASLPSEALEDFMASGVLERADGAFELACDPAWEVQTYAAQSNNVWPLLDRVQCPIDVLRAAKGSTSLRAAAWLLQMSTPETKIEQIVGASGVLPLQQPDLVQERILAMAGLQVSESPQAALA